MNAHITIIIKLSTVSAFLDASSFTFLVAFQVKAATTTLAPRMTIEECCYLKAQHVIGIEVEVNDTVIGIVIVIVSRT